MSGFPTIYHGSCAVVDDVACGVQKGMFPANPGHERHVVMQVIAHIGERHPKVQLDGTLPDDYEKTESHSGAGLWYTKAGQLIVLTGVSGPG